IDPFDKNLNGFILESFNRLLDGTRHYHEHETVDVIGSVVAIEDVVPVQSAAGQKIRRIVVIEDSEAVKKMVSSIRECEQKSHYIVYAKIHRIHKENGWAYTACKECNKKVNVVESKSSSSLGKNKVVFYCEDHGSVQVTSWYKVIMRIIDQSGSAPIVFFNTMINKLLGYTAWELMERHGMDVDEYWPEELLYLVGKRFLFNIYFSDYNVNNNNYTYRCDAVNDDPEFIKHFKDGFMQDEDSEDEIKDFLNCRYMSACEAAWRIYGFEIHYRTPSVELFPFHLKDEQQTDTFARTLLYVEIPKFYVWNQKQRIWTRRKQVRGSMEWDDLKKVDDVLYPTYRDACYARGLLQDDKEYIDGILEESLWGMGDYFLTTEQKGIYSTFVDAVDNNKGGMFFVYGYGGTGKTYLYKTMSAALRSKGDIVLNVASSGIAALLLEGRRTTHSCFAIPINVVEDSMYHIVADSELADIICKANLIIWGEAPMINRHCYEAFDRNLRDICRTDSSVASDKVFGGKVVLFSSDFRQTLPVITNSGRQDVVNVTINSSYLWEKCSILRLTVNMRLGSGSTKSEKKKSKNLPIGY
nr:ATP-dependent DNA helicase PIF1-like [Tanacetum cinerariifolium]